MSASPKLVKQIGVVFAQQERLMEINRGLLEKCRTQSPDTVEIAAMAAILHSFYTGIENLFKRITLETGGAMPHSEFWHGDLLESMRSVMPERPAVIGDDLRSRLKGYLDFRHVFRHAYTFELNWSRMAPLALGMEETLQILKDEVNAFLVSIGQESIT